jgi:hypothetical protein
MYRPSCAHDVKNTDYIKIEFDILIEEFEEAPHITKESSNYKQEVNEEEQSGDEEEEEDLYGMGDQELDQMISELYEQDPNLEEINSASSSKAASVRPVEPVTANKPTKSGEMPKWLKCRLRAQYKRKKIEREEPLAVASTSRPNDKVDWKKFRRRQAIRNQQNKKKKKNREKTAVKQENS